MSTTIHSVPQRVLDSVFESKPEDWRQHKNGHEENLPALNSYINEQTSSRDRQALEDYFIGALANYVSPEIWRHCLEHAKGCLTALRGEGRSL